MNSRFTRKNHSIDSLALRVLACEGVGADGTSFKCLDELLSDYHITYDSEKFVVEYVPNGSNLLPSISVLPVNARKGGAR